ncbi:hypothetical protein NXS19_004566 [Fusarium pseudograminearum]|nr:hypothetical protein NXS19_004566 [Fusarium pseudograminearum]
MRYLWVDAVCIDQDDRQKKHEQMDYMASIYRGAWATIVAVDSNSRNSGMSRVHPESQRSHQLRIEFGNGNILIQKFPSFDQQLAVSPWMGRGWTYQEALLSQRLVLFTKHQVYYSCNSMSCCEALNDEQAFGDNIKPISHHAGNKDDRPPKTDLHFPTRNELRRNKLLEYERLLNLYLRRHLSYDKDILNAFAGLLQRLQQLAFPTGFWNGLPKESFMQCLLWRQERHDYDSYGCPRCCTNPALATRRKCLPFPTWSWTGWHLKSGVHFPHCVAEFEQEERDKIRDKVDLRPPLIIETANGQALFDNLRDTHRMWQPRKRHRHHLKPLLARLSTTRAHTAIESSCHSPDPPNPYRKGFSAPKTSDSIDNCTFDPEMEKDTKLKVRGIVLELPCRTSVSRGRCSSCLQDFTRTKPEFDGHSLNNPTNLVFESKWYVDGLWNTFEVKGRETKKQKLLLLECYRSKKYQPHLKLDIVLNLLILHWEDGNAIRGGTLTITLMAKDLQAFLKVSRPQMDDIWLA